MTSFGAASFFVVLIVAFGVSNSKACTHDSDCLPVSEPLPFDDVPMVNAKCFTDTDCIKACPPTCRPYCLHFFCVCYCSG
ncbi:hypothetical protein ES332_A08G231500v1 [Gossypium tomentosum]|uniref:Uncharacterized protein n=1 Tax=Gossypium tomentosum TaxID=34277 RepID=A0A5D2PJ98_GOSTO|nr:hypothetical protein ES332_A08G231500v1 [Gossypium tomentosum]